MKFVVNRGTWLRGGKDGYGESADASLENRYGHRCCLGFLGAACGLRPDEDLAGLGHESVTLEGALTDSGEPNDSDGSAINWPTSLQVISENANYVDDDGGYSEPDTRLESSDTELVGEIIGVNDDDKISDEIREARLTELFRKGGIEVSFVG